MKIAGMRSSVPLPRNAILRKLDCTPHAHVTQSHRILLILESAILWSNDTTNVRTAERADTEARTSNEGTDLRLRETHKILVGHAHSVAMRSGVEDNLLVPGQRLIDIYWQVIEKAKWRHRTEFAVREEFAELELRR